MSLKSFLPAAAALAVATVALTGCTQTANVSGGDSSAPAASSAPEASSNPRTDTKSDAPSDSGKSDASDTFTIDESNAHVEIPAGTKTVVINGSNNHIQGHGGDGQGSRGGKEGLQGHGVSLSYVDQLVKLNQSTRRRG